MKFDQMSPYSYVCDRFFQELSLSEHYLVYCEGLSSNPTSLEIKIHDKIMRFNAKMDEIIERESRSNGKTNVTLLIEKLRLYDQARTAAANKHLKEYHLGF